MEKGMERRGLTAENAKIAKKDGFNPLCNHCFVLFAFFAVN
jgi:hypothetical protein